MLAREGYVDADTTFDKNLPVSMEAVESIFDAREVRRGDSVPANKVAEVHEGRQGLDHV